MSTSEDSSVYEVSMIACTVTTNIALIIAWHFVVWDIKMSISFFHFSSHIFTIHSHEKYFFYWKFWMLFWVVLLKIENHKEKQISK